MADTHGDKARASSTPRTDAVAIREKRESYEHKIGIKEYVMADFARELEREGRGKQAVIDRLMIEYCPDEMTPEQIEEWKRHQVAAGPEATAKLDAATERLRTRSADVASTEEARYTLGDLDTFCQLAASAAIQCALQAIEDEPEVPGEMPDEMWSAINGDRDACANAIRIAVKQTKKGIEERLLASEPAKQTPRSATERTVEEEPLYTKLLPHWELALDTYERCLKEKRAKSYAIREALITIADRIEKTTNSPSDRNANG